MDVAMRMLAYRVFVDFVDDYVQIVESTDIESLNTFTKVIVVIFGDKYLRSPNNDDTTRLLEIGNQCGFPGMGGIESLDIAKHKLDENGGTYLIEDDGQMESMYIAKHELNENSGIELNEDAGRIRSLYIAKHELDENGGTDLIEDAGQMESLNIAKHELNEKWQNKPQRRCLTGPQRRCSNEP
ncbi:hypothetical protein QYF36_002267 [Acer negundo]|nr:hypothetical protein QYF36_002267 [Acer negundo]